MSLSKLSYKTNTARAILGNAGLFKYPQHVIWEYVTNEIQYRDKKVKPLIYVTLDNKKIIIQGNGEGMDEKGLANFFILHGQNQDRLKGKHGRGKHGTGKSAAFAIANNFRIRTIKNKKLYELEITKKDLKKYEAQTGDIPLEKCVKINGKKINSDNGTTIEISEINVKLNKKEIIEELEKKLFYWKEAEVWVNEHKCKYDEPQIKDKIIINSHKTHPELGNIDLTIKVSAEPLEKEKNGIAILTSGVLQETTLCGAENKEMANYIFGEIDCPILDEDDQDVAATTIARDMKLNPENKRVKAIYSFIGPNVEIVRKKLVLENEKLKESENQKKLQKHAEKMQEKINKHFEKWKNKVVMKFNRPSDGKLGIAEDQNSNINNLNGSLSVGDEIEALTDLAFNFAKDLKNKGQNLESKNKNKNSLKEKENENKKAKKVNGSGNNKSSGGTKFKVEYQNNGDQNPRAKFDSENNIVFINLEHPQVLKLINDVGKNNDYTKDPMFRKISDEIAFTEYAFGLANLLYQKKYYAENTDEYLREARSIINELSNIY